MEVVKLLCTYDLQQLRFKDDSGVGQTHSEVALSNIGEQMVPLQLALLCNDEKMVNFLHSSDGEALQHSDSPLPLVRHSLLSLLVLTLQCRRRWLILAQTVVLN